MSFHFNIKQVLDKNKGIIFQWDTDEIYLSSFARKKFI